MQPVIGSYVTPETMGVLTRLERRTRKPVSAEHWKWPLSQRARKNLTKPFAGEVRR